MTKSKKHTIIKLGDNRFKVIDLTEPLRLDGEVFPGDPKPEKKEFCSFEKNNCQYHIYSVGDHNYHPHGDGPNHHNAQCKHIGFDFWGLDFAFNKACMLDLSETTDSVSIDGITYLKQITAEHLLPHVGKIEKSTALVLRTGYDRWLEDNRKHSLDNIPYIDESAVDVISEIKKLKVIGIDSLTVDKIGSNYAHRKFKDALIVECLVNLYSIGNKYRHNFCLQTSPIAIVGATGGPVLVYAYIKMDATH